VAQALRIREDTGVRHVALSGGVFQNRVLTEKVIELLNAHGFTATLPTSVPVNDGGIAFGQIIEAAHNGIH
jgi:hydrogenase maturation protein HypF